jgi:hypothetical protein
VGVEEVSWDKGCIVRTGDYTLFCGKGKWKSSIWNRSFVRHKILLTVNTVEFTGDRMSYTSTVLRGRWCNVISLNAQSTEDKSDELKHNFYEELVHVLNYFPKYRMKTEPFVLSSILWLYIPTADQRYGDNYCTPACCAEKGVLTAVGVGEVVQGGTAVKSYPPR